MADPLPEYEALRDRLCKTVRDAREQEALDAIDVLLAQVRALTRERDEALAAMNADVADVVLSNAAMRAELKRLRAAVERYANHDVACPAYGITFVRAGECTCGLEAALSQARSAEQPGGGT